MSTNSESLKITDDCPCCCCDSLSSELDNGITVPSDTGSMGLTENGTCLNCTSSYFSYSSDKTKCGVCVTVPLEASAMSLNWVRLGGQDGYNSSYNNDFWMPAGGCAVFSFLPQLNTMGGFYQSIFSEDGTYSFGSGAGFPVQVEHPILGFQDPANTTYFTTYHQETGVYFEYFGGQLTAFDALYGRVNRRYDTRGNVLQYNYAPNTTSSQLLRSITGEIGGNVIPYFYYADETLDGFAHFAPITKIYVLDVANASNSRTIYFEYTSYHNPITNDSLQYLSKVVNPTGCTQLYDPITPFNDLHDTYQLRREVDAEGFQTYFAYSGATLSQVTEPEGRIVYYEYVSFGETHQVPLGRNKSFMLWDVSGFGQQMFLPKRDTDALGNTTYFGYDATLKRIVQQVDPNQNITYYRYVGGGGANRYALALKLSAFNQAQTYFGYVSGLFDLAKMVGPRQTSTFSQTTYYQYDSFRNRTVMVDALGETTLYGRDAEGHLVRQMDARGNTTYYNYNLVTGNLDSQSDALGDTAYYGYSSFRDKVRSVSPRWVESTMAAFTTYFVYDQLARMTARVDPLNNVTYWDYTARSLLLDTVDAVGTDTSYTYNGLRLMTQKTVTSLAGTQLTQEKYGYDIYKNRTALLDARLNATYYTYDQIDRLTSQVDALKEGTYYFYDSVGNRTVLRDARGNSTYFGYDLLSRQTAMRDALGNATYFGYDLSNNRTAILDPNRNPAYFFYDQLDRLQATRDALANPTYFYFDLVGNRSTVTDARSNTTYYFYDQANRNTVIRDAQGNVTYFGFDARGNKIRVMDARLNSTYFIYDALDRSSRSIDALSNPTYIFYDAVSNRTQLMDARFNTTYYFYDGLHRTTARRDALADSTYFFYDATNNQTALRNPNAHSTYFGYDTINRLIQIQDALGNATYFSYDSVGNRTKVTDADKHTTYFQFDTINRLSAIRFPDTGSAYFFYDPASNRTKDVDPLGKATYYAYDALNRASRTTDALFRTVYFEYDPVSNLSRQVGAEGESSAYTYDALNRRTNIAYTPAGAVVSASLGTNPYFVYDPVSNLVQMGDLWGLHLMGYDADNRIVRHLHPNQSVVYFEYDPTWNQTTVAYPGTSGRSGRGYDAVNRQIRIQSPSGETAYFAYDSASNLTQRLLANSVKLTATYDPVERISQWRHANASGGSLTYFDYSRDAKGLITKAVREATYTTYYTYDPNDRLTKEVWAKTGATPSEVYGYRYAYDLAGNRLKALINGAATYYLYDKANQLTVKGTNAKFATPTYYVYDKNGSVTNMVPSSGAATYFAYNTEGLVARIKWADATTTYFFYDGKLRRYGMNANGSMTYFLWDGSNLLQELNLNGTVKEEHTNATSSLPGIGQVVEVNRPGQTQQKIYPVMDWRGTITKWMQSDGLTVFSSRESDAFGTIIPNSLTGTWPGRWGYQGQSWMEVTSGNGSQTLLLSPTRLYNPTDGIFVQRDPLPQHAFVGQPSRNTKSTDWQFAPYQYISSQPTALMDPSGLITSGPIQQGGGGTLAVQTTVITGPGGRCGQYNVAFTFDLYSPAIARASGWIIQRIFRSGYTQYCDYEFFGGGPQVAPGTEFWEAFPVSFFSTRVTDTFLYGGEDHTYGFLTTLGEARFYSSDDPAFQSGFRDGMDPSTDPDWNNPAFKSPDSGAAPSTWNKPRFWDASNPLTTPMVFHGVDVQWWCCCYGEDSVNKYFHAWP